MMGSKEDSETPTTVDVAISSGNRIKVSLRAQDDRPIIETPFGSIASVSVNMNASGARSLARKLSAIADAADALQTEKD